MKILSAMTIALPVHLSSVRAGPIRRMTRQRFQASIHTLIDDEMALILESSSIGDYSEGTSTSSDLHRKTKSRRPKQAAAPTQLRGSHLNQTAIDVSLEMDDLFDSIATHGWDTILSRSSNEEELFLVCHEMPVSLGVDRLQLIMDALELDNTNTIYYEPVRSTVDDLCVIMSIKADVALDWHNSNNSSDVSLVPWVDAMKITPGIVSQFATVDATDNGALSSYSIVFSIAQNSDTHVDVILADVIEMASSGQRRRRQEEEEQTLFQSFSLTKTRNKTSSNRYWSRMLTEYEDCSSMIDGLAVSSLNDNAAYRVSYNSAAAAAASETCLVSLLVSLAIHPTVTRVGTIEDSVELHNLHASWVVQGSVTDFKGSDFFPFSAAGLDGRSQLVSISDTGLDVNNCYFRDSDDFTDGSIFKDWDMSKRKILRYDYDRSGGDNVDLLSGHGTHVSGTIIGSHLNGLGHEKDGVAPAARAHFFDICTANRCLSPTKRWFDSLSSNGNSTNKPTVLAASWGTNYLSSYDYTCQQYDKLVYENPDVLLISSAGNSGERFANPFYTIGAPASCKNTMAVGATFNAPLFGQPDAVASFSSRGPSSDGRIKPDLLAPGFRLSSAIAGHHDCWSEEAEFLRAGTSMAQPVVSGAALLIRQYFEEAFYPCGYKGCGQSLSPSGSLVKAVLMNGATFKKVVAHASYGYIKTDQPLSPYDNTQGFGAANLLLSLPLRNNNDFGMFVTDKTLLRLGQYHSFELKMDLHDCKSDLSVTLAWTDPPATIGCTSCLVNDLDLVVEDVGTFAKHYPNGKQTPDRINNVERVRIDSAQLASGQKFRVRVTASHIGPRYDFQQYSLVATGCFSSPENDSEHQPVSTHSVEQLTFATKNYRLMSKHRASGLMFAVKARTHGVVINSFSINTHLDEDSNIFVYKLKDIGLHLNETELDDETLWEMISPQLGFEVNATGATRDLTVLPPDAFEVPIPRGSSQAFYITFASEKGIVCGRPRWSIKEAREKKRDSNIKIEGEIGRPRLFSGRIIDPCFLDGSVKYSVNHLID